MKKTSMPKIKTFKRFMKEEKETYYIIDLTPDMTNDYVVYLFNQLLPLTMKMLKNGSVLVKAEPVIEGEEQ